MSFQLLEMNHNYIIVYTIWQFFSRVIDEFSITGKNFEKFVQPLDFIDKIRYNIIDVQIQKEQIEHHQNQG